MSISIDWGAKVISIPKAYLTEVSDPIYEMDLDAFRLDLKSLEDSEEGIVFLDTHCHNTEVVLGGVTYARFIEIINGYTITFEEGTYVVNLVGANSNVLDAVNQNYVSIRSANSAGLVNNESAADIADEVWTHTDGLKVSDLHDLELGRWKIDTATKQMTLYKADGQTPLVTFDLKDANGDPSYQDVYERVPV